MKGSFSMEYRYRTQGTCSREIIIDVEDGIVRSLEIVGGCEGNRQGIAALVQGMPAAEVAVRLKGIDCGGKGTSCPDQVARAISSIMERDV